ncbi:MAG TPA: DUF448 domain-containing protein [Solirubrobacteraceae bacterium]
MAAPERRCVACGRRAPKSALRRVAVVGDRVVADPGATLPGRGAYVCDAACARVAIDRRAFPRAFRRMVSVGDDLVESM